MKMDRAALEEATVEQLRKEAKRYRLPSTGDRAELIDSIMSHFERHGPSDLLQTGRREIESTQSAGATAQSEPLTAEVFRETMMQMQ